MISRIFLAIIILALAACGGGGEEGSGSQFYPQPYVIQGNELMCVEYTPSNEQEQNDILSIGGYPGSCSRSNALGQCEYFSYDTNFSVRSIYYQDTDGLITVDMVRQGCEHVQGSFSEISQDNGSDSGDNGDSSNPDLEVPPVDLDSDNDGFSDFLEVEYDTSISDWNSNPSAILSTPVSFVNDNDSDGFADYIEAWYYTDPNDSSSMPIDEDGNQIPDGFDSSADTDAPKLLSFDISSEVVIIETGQESVSFNMTVVDDISGIRSISLVLSDSANQEVYASIYGDQVGGLVHGVSLLGSEFGEYATAGDWTISYISIEDVAGNNTSYSFADLALLGFDNKVTIENSKSDTQPPVLDNFSLAGDLITITTGQEVVTFNVETSDDVSGIGRIDIVLRGPTGQTVYSSLYDAQLGLLQHTLALDSSELGLYAAAGEWVIDYVTITDNAENRSSYDTSALNGLGFESSIEIENTNVDNQAPVLESFAIVEDLINVQTGNETVTFDLKVTDNVSGLDRVEVSLVSPNNSTVNALIYGDSLGGNDHTLSLESSEFGEYAEEGQWDIQYVLLTDKAGNSRYLGKPDIDQAGFESSIQVYNY